MVTLIALYNLYFYSFLTSDPEERSALHSASTLLGEAYHRDINQNTEKKKYLIDAIREVMTVFESKGIMKKLAEFEGNAKMQHFVLNYMKQFEMILQFVRSTIQQDLQLHMESLAYLTKYFFAHDHQNYACLLPLYITTMQETERQHPDLWAEFMKGNFCVTKGVAGFTSISPDQGIEQENRTLKVIGGIVGITQNEKALDKFFLIAPELSKLLQNTAVTTTTTEHNTTKSQAGSSLE